MHNYLNFFFRNFLVVFSLISLIFSFDLIGVLVEFQPDFVNQNSGEIIDDPETSGDGQFLTSEDLDLSFIQYQDVSKCTSFLVDKPPHNSDYFLLQMLAVKNYYNSISNNEIDFEIGVIDSVFQLDNNMRYYSTSDSQIGLLFSESIDQVNAANANGDLFLKTIDKIGDNSYIYDSTETFVSGPDILYVVFHAGLGQESSTDFDPTIYDIRSAFVDDTMLNLEWSLANNINTGIVMPETLNMIYYDVIEDAIPTNAEGADLEDFYCNQQFGMTGLFAHLLGYSFGFPPLHNIENGQPRVGVFDLMDVGFFNGRGIIPSPPSAWIRANENFNFGVNNILENITEDINDEALSYQLSSRSSLDKIYRIDISNDEYFLIENCTNYLDAFCSDSTYETQDACENDLDCDNDGDTDENDTCNWITIDSVDDLYELYVYEINNEEFNDLPEWILNGYFDESLESITLIPGWFDVMTNERSEYFEIDGNGIIPGSDIFNPNYNVITSVDNYDSGLPGSGLLIWHIDEPVYNNGYEYGINDDLFNKAIALEEGDGSADIGDLNLLYGIWSNEKFISGHKWDLWRKGNIGYKQNNYINSYNENESMYFNSNSFPDSRTNSGVLSNVSLRVLSSYGQIMEFEVQTEIAAYDAEIIYLDEDYKIIGNNGVGCIYYLSMQNEIFKYCEDSSTLIMVNNMTNPQMLYYNEQEYLVEADAGYYFDEVNLLTITSAEINPMGVFYADGNGDNIFGESEIALSLGDIDDNDSFHEIIYINNGNLIVENYNGSAVNGFPILGNYSGVPLILNISNESSGAEIICVNGDKIDVLSNKGQLLYQISYFGDSDISALAWNSDDIALINGNRLYIFEDVYDENLSYWMNPYSRPSNYPEVTGTFDLESNIQSNNIGIDLNRVYNYPNPVEENSTRFRFYVYNSNSVHIDIYDVAGYKVITLNKNQLIENEYNEILWESVNLPPGLYFASVKSDTNQSKVLKVVIQ